MNNVQYLIDEIKRECSTWNTIIPLVDDMETEDFALIVSLVDQSHQSYWIHRIAEHRNLNPQQITIKPRNHHGR